MSKKQKQQRILLIQTAAKLMYEEGVSQYLDAKKIASKRLYGKQLKNLPSNGEISDELYRISQFQRPVEHMEQLYAMRIRAVEVMAELHPFSPRLIGSVSTGRIREGSDIDLHIFCNDLMELCNYLDNLNWIYEVKNIVIQQGSKLTGYNHIYCQFDYPVELSAYSEKEIRVRARSSTDGKIIDRLSISKVKQLINTEHWDLRLKGFE